MKFTHLDVVDGLSQSTVYAIHQDHLGLMWIGTRDGLNKYDAGNFTVYRNAPSDTTSLSDNFIQAIFEDQNQRLWIGTSNGLNLYNRTIDRFTRISLPESPIVIDHEEPSVNAIVGDKQGNIWVATDSGLFKIIEDTIPQASLVFCTQETSPGTTAHVFPAVRCIFEDVDGLLWLGTENGLLGVVVNKSIPDRLIVTKFFEKGETSGSLNDDWINTIAEVEKGKLWIGTKNGGINILDKATDTFIYYRHVPGDRHALPDNDVRSILKDRRENIWLGTFNGLSLYQDGEFFTYTDQQSNGISNNSVRPIFQDRRGSIWIGTYFGGVSILDPDIPNFRNFYHRPNTNSLSYNVVSSFTPDQHGNLWIGTEGGGLNYYDTATGKFTSFQHSPLVVNSLSHNNVKALFKDSEGTLWIGTFQGGLDALKEGQQTFINYRNDPKQPNSLSDNRIYAIAQDARQGDLYIGTYGGGLNIKRKHSKDSFEVIRYPHITSDYIRTIFQDSRENLWIGTRNGLNLKRPDEDTFKTFKSDPKNRKTISGNVIICIFEDSRNNLWIGTYNDGLNRYNPYNDTFTRYDETNGLPGNNIFGILEDNLGNLWLSTNAGLCRFNPVSGMIRNYNTTDGLNSNEFNFGAFAKLKNGNMAFGHTRGFTIFAPDSMKVNAFVPQIIFSDFKLFNKSVVPGKTSFLKQHISITQSITLTHDQNVFSLEFAVLNYIMPKKNAYAYKLEGFDNEWNYVGSPTASYTNLNAGDYTLLVKGSNNDGVWNDAPAVMHIRILPPPWRTWWAHLIYVILASIAIYTCIKFINVRNKLKHELLVEHIALEKQQEVHEEKLNFFANISHEFRTPLSLIVGPIERLLVESAAMPEAFKSLLHTAQCNGRRLLRLVDQILDFRKQESGLMRLHAGQIEMVEFLTQIIDTFKYLADEKQIHLSFDNEQGKSLMLWGDSEQLEKVIFNLLSNAFKFTLDGGRINLKLTSAGPSKNYPAGVIQIIVEDTGIGIPEDKWGAIFDQFYQAYDSGKDNRGAAPGSGIGLALADGLVKLHGGTIAVASNLGSGMEPHEINTRFTVSIPAGKAHLDEKVFSASAGRGIDAVVSDHVPPNAVSSGLLEADSLATGRNKGLEGERPLILVVDDNDELRKFISDGLRSQYAIIEANNGLAAWEMIEQAHPDIVISDVMMPVSDGIELLMKIKSEEETSHIAVVLLTARTAPEQVIAALEKGSDDYITKPFSFEALALKISNILQTREHIRKKFIREHLLTATLTATAAKTHNELAKIIEVVENNLAHKDFNVNVLAAEVGASRTALYHKIKRLTGLNIIEFINSIRLRKAAQLLGSQHHLTISEVAYDVGFNDPKYFSRSFKSFFGMTPKEYTQSIRDGKSTLLAHSPAR